MEFTVFKIEVKLVLTEAFKNLGDVGDMVYEIMGISLDVVNKTGDHVSKDLVREVLKNGGGGF